MWLAFSHLGTVQATIATQTTVEPIIHQPALDAIDRSLKPLRLDSSRSSARYARVQQNSTSRQAHTFQQPAMKTIRALFVLAATAATVAANLRGAETSQVSTRGVVFVVLPGWHSLLPPRTCHRPCRPFCLARAPCADAGRRGGFGL